MRSPRLAVEPVRKIMVAEAASRILTLIFVAPICSCAVSGGVEVMADIAVDAVEGSSRSSELPLLVGEQPNEQQIADWKEISDVKFRADTRRLPLTPHGHARPPTPASFLGRGAGG